MTETKPRTEFKEPADLLAAESQRNSLVEEVAGIATQLSDKDRRHPDGTRFSNEDYHSWRKKALVALRARESVLRRLNGWLAQEKRRLAPMEPEGAPATGPHKVIGEAYQLFLRLQDEDVDFSPEELATVEQLRAYLTGEMEP